MHPMRKSMRPQAREEAQTLALSALAFLAGERARLVRFLDVTGLGPDELRARAADPALLAAVLDHLLTDESALLVFAASAGVAPEAVAPARDVLRGDGWEGR
jgi:hypothetical protein